MKLWIDDKRDPQDWTDDPENWVWVKTYHEAVEILEDNLSDITDISFDHDLGMFSFSASGRELSGYDIALWLVNLVNDDKLGHRFNSLSCHSANPVGRERILGVIDRYLKEYIK